MLIGMQDVQPICNNCTNEDFYFIKGWNAYVYEYFSPNYAVLNPTNFAHFYLTLFLPQLAAVYFKHILKSPVWYLSSIKLLAKLAISKLI